MIESSAKALEEIWLPGGSTGAQKWHIYENVLKPIVDTENRLPHWFYRILGMGNTRS